MPTADTTTFKPHGDIWAAGRLSKDSMSAMRWFYCAPDGNLDMGQKNTSLVEVITFTELHRWTPQFGDEVVADFATTIAAGATATIAVNSTITGQAPMGAYYAWALGAVASGALKDNNNMKAPLSAEMVRTFVQNSVAKRVYNSNRRRLGTSIGYIIELLLKYLD